MMREPPKRSWDLTSKGVSRVLADEAMWFRKGTILFKAFEILSKGVPNFVLDGIYVGEQVSKQVQSLASDDEHSLQAVPLMLYGMALECWLKGLIIKKHARLSSVTKDQIEGEIDLFLKGDEDEFLSLLLSVFEQPSVAPLMKRLNAELDQEDAEVQQKIKEHSKHRLGHMAEKAGLVGITSADRQWLDFFSDMIMLGRYPAQFSAERTIPWEGALNQIDMIERLNSLVFKAYESST